MKLSLATAGLLTNDVIPAMMTTQHHSGATTRVGGSTNIVQGEMMSGQKHTGTTGSRRYLFAERMSRGKANRALKNGQGTFWSSRKNKVLPCNPTSTDADTGILSCGENSFCKPVSWSLLGGVCTGTSQAEFGHGFDNDGESAAGAVLMKSSTVLAPHECKPALIDVGILGCQEGEFCKVDETSKLGGICVRAVVPSRRRLATVDDFLPTCDPSNEYYSSACDCSTWNVTGTISCVYEDQNFGFDVPGCDEVIGDMSTILAFEGRTLSSITNCYDITLPYSQKACVSLNVPAGASIADSCSIEFNGVDCNSCVSNDYFYDFDCSNVDGGTVGTSFVEWSSVLTQCYTGAQNNTCTNLCAEGYSIPESRYDYILTIPDNGEVSCGFLAYSAANALIRDAICTSVTTAAQENCCQPSEATVPTEESEPEEETTPSPDVDSDGGVAFSFQSILTTTCFVMGTILLLAS